MAHFEKRGSRWRASIKSKAGRVSKSFDTKDEAQRWAHMQEGTGGGRGAKGTVGEYLDQWLSDLETMDLIRRNTLDGSYRSKVASAKASFGHVRMLKLEVDHVQDWLNSLRDAGRAKSYISQARLILNKAFGDAVRARLIPFNPVSGAKAPKQSGPSKPDCMSAEDARKYLETIADRHPLYGMFMRVAVMSGMRRSEIGGLRWEDVDLDGGKVEVRQTLIRVSQGDGKPSLWQFSAPKSASSARTIPVPAPVIGILRQRRQTQREERMKAGPAWQDHGLVFADPIGQPLNLDTLSATVRRIKLDLGLKGQPVHGLRHLYGTSQNKIGTDVATIQAMMGHSRSTTTLDYYIHADDDQKSDAADAMGDMFG
ncbi:tyrosine-type recombinase/integrase [Primorskyibacter sp. S87]|uniref:tyrosine-type recombinase/integrase n=1 Tax=Primorskyibacter sp. S87 TaxID=3415126 RepID=UPI003C7BA3BB